MAAIIVLDAVLLNEQRSPDVLLDLSTPYDKAIRDAAAAHMPTGWDWRILKAMVFQESRFNAHARSSAGARGLMQLMPATARELGVAPWQLYSAELNIATGTRYLRRMWQQWDGVPDHYPRWQRTRLALASYNAGGSRVKRAVGRAGSSRWPDIKSFLPAETREYVSRILADWYPRCRKRHPGYCPGVYTGFRTVYRAGRFD